MTLIAIEFMSLDGVVQGPSSPEEDRSGGFRHGGWHGRFLENLSMQWIVENLVGSQAYLLGRGTYDIFAAHWPDAGPGEAILAQPLNTRPKHVVSSRPLDPNWTNARLLEGDLAASVTQLKSETTGRIALIGSPVLAQSLLALGLIDELRVMIDPIVIGSGKRLFGDASNPVNFELSSCVSTVTGSLLATYSKLPK
ncbi:dihydrofolate reductase family protein [Devosia sp.]|uniref:dihydrofolate reductase family protein n=1 Tax=Devosia sp. TaxID=1871048 RepID=UPI002FCAA636